MIGRMTICNLILLKPGLLGREYRAEREKDEKEMRGRGGIDDVRAKARLMELEAES
jgi:hypothetical protein